MQSIVGWVKAPLGAATHRRIRGAADGGLRRADPRARDEGRARALTHLRDWFRF